MPDFYAGKSLYYKDVNLISNKLNLLSSRTLIEVPNNRFIAAPMGGLVGKKFIEESLSIGLSFCIHRICSALKQQQMLKDAIAYKEALGSKSLIWYSVGLKDWEERINPIYPMLVKHQIGILLDVANGFNINVGEALQKINAKYPLPNLFAGNVHTYQGLNYLSDSGARFVRVGIASGGVCDTKNQTGINRGQVTEITDCYENALADAAIVADGGIRSPGDAAKAFGAGAEYVMLGSYFSRAYEAACHENEDDGIFYGGASLKAKVESNGRSATSHFVEGLEVPVTPYENLRFLVEALANGVKSAISYSGQTTLKDYIGRGTFEIIHS